MQLAYIYINVYKGLFHQTSVAASVSFDYFTSKLMKYAFMSVFFFKVIQVTFPERQCPVVDSVYDIAACIMNMNVCEQTSAAGLNRRRLNLPGPEWLLLLYSDLKVPDVRTHLIYIPLMN